ncbi:MAG: ATP-grasp domain-containing protein, partial [Proteobacteria bacterium]|nr:ATP-grasp domain-containing protein [Pseudomonadota bacterium]
GKGQKQITCLAEGVTVWNDLGSVPLVYEQWIPFERELSLVACRDRFGKMVFYPLVENIHKKGILELTWAPAENVSPDLQRLAESYAVSVCQKINYVGVLALELFQWGTQLLINEMASRVHNTGHWSIEGAQTSQFENHLRAGLGLSLGDPQPCGYSAMLNLIGTIPAQIEQLKKEIGVFVHLYGKNPQPGRKLGHITVVSENTHSLKDKLNRVRGICGI